MSSILRALKKLENEQPRQEAVGALSGTVRSYRKKRRESGHVLGVSPKTWGAGLAFLAGAGIIVSIYLPKSRPAGDEEQNRVIARHVAEPAAAPALPVKKARRDTPDISAAKPAAARPMRPAAVKRKESAAALEAVAPATRPEAGTATSAPYPDPISPSLKSGNLPPAGAPADDMDGLSQAGGDEKTLKRPSAATVKKEMMLEETLPEKTGVKEASIENRGVENTGKDDTVRPDLDVPGDAGLPLFPPSEGKLKLMAIAWSDDPAGRMAVINGGIVREGGSVAGVRVQQINADEVVLQKNSRNYRLVFQPD